eukprot:CAMPEP_0195306766 /NCGR_PEP_ID=MMETSP0707-20130614/37367_1 /TAXON_ID=33640 /ORGANISM="Asterionellopsis glacialis, Strain CCMP134" /LENGTH=537 /DNA_ID=CAMNT_0040370993 /DNA_START=87 /DNA_END=1700 /DNA_ORIENTATION=-
MRSTVLHQRCLCQSISSPWTRATAVRKLVSQNSTIATLTPKEAVRGLSTTPRTVLHDNHQHSIHPFVSQKTKNQNKKKNVVLPNGKSLSSVAVNWDDDENYYDNGNNDINSPTGDIDFLENGEEQLQHPPSSYDYGQHSPGEKHCDTCTCSSTSHSNSKHDNKAISPSSSSSSASHQSQSPIPIITTTTPYKCGMHEHNNNNNNNNNSYTELPPPLPEPLYTFHKRVLPPSCTALGASPQGRRRLLEALSNNTAESYWALSEHFTNQSDPAFCGVTTLLVVLNAMCVDPHVRWRHGWRWYGDEELLLDRCCIPPEKIRRARITIEEFANLAKCQGLKVTLRRPTTVQISNKSTNNDNATNGEVCQDDLQQFRNDILRMVQSPPLSTENDTNENCQGGYQQGSQGILVVSFARSSLGQTGEGYFSPIAAYQEDTDSVLVMDVARFKYAPYWVAVKDLYNAMQPLDGITNRPRGWFLLYPPSISPNIHGGPHKSDEHQRPANIVRQVGEGDMCPIGKIKIDYCRVNGNRTKKIEKQYSR